MAQALADLPAEAAQARVATLACRELSLRLQQRLYDLDPIP